MLEPIKVDGWFVLKTPDIPCIYPGSEDHIYSHHLKLFGFRSGCRDHFSKDRLDIYESVLDQLKRGPWFYACQCTRKMPGSKRYLCRHMSRFVIPTSKHQAIRVKVQGSANLFR